MAAVPPLAFLARYDLAFQVSPIIFVGGIISASQGGLAPITSFTGGMPSSLDNAFARYLPMAGSTLIAQSVATYPFANQNVAANATIVQPLTLSMRMIAPVNQAGGYLSKMPTFSALQQAFQSHNAAGGTYTVATPASMYYWLLMTGMTDITPDDAKQQQIEYQIDFVQPLLTLDAAAAAQGALFQKITGGQPVNFPPSWTGNVNASPVSLPGVPGGLGNTSAQNVAGTSSVGNLSAALATFGGSL